MLSLNENDPLVRSAVFGAQVQHFLDGEIGQYLLSKVHQEREEALEQLSTVSPWRRRKITSLQNKVWVCDHFEKWLADAIIDGENSTRIIEGNDE
jgi:hypothetical protein